MGWDELLLQCTAALSCNKLNCLSLLLGGFLAVLKGWDLNGFRLLLDGRGCGAGGERADGFGAMSRMEVKLGDQAVVLWSFSACDHSLTKK